ncbi:MAG: hypothetical protein AAF498_16305, partial [Pseudomonadota bacterium]
MAKQVKLRQQLSPVWWIALCLIAILFVGLLVTWSFRKSIAEGALANWCAGNGWTCQGTFTTIGLGKIGLEGVSIATDTGEPVTADLIEAGIKWAWFLRPQIVSIDSDNPVVRGTLTEDGVGLHGLESLLRSDGDSGGETGPIPRLDINGGRVLLSTMSGDVEALFEAQGRPFLDGRIAISFPAQNLQNETADLVWSGGDIVLDYAGGETAGSLALDIDRMAVAGVSADMISAQLNVSDTDGNLTVDGALSAASLAGNEMSSEEVGVSFEAQVGRLQELTRQGVIDAIQSITINAEARNASVFGSTASRTSTLVELGAQEERALSGPVSLSLSDVTGSAAAETIRLSGETTLGQQGRIASEFDGKLQVTNGSLTEEYAAPFLSFLSLPSPLDLHGNALRGAALGAFADFDGEVKFRANTDERGFNADILSPVSFTASSGLEIVLSNPVGKPLMEMSGNQAMASADVKLSGGGGPSLQFTIDQFSQSIEAGTSAHLSEIVLDPWSASGRSVSADLEELEVVSDQDLQLAIRGNISFEGDYPGITLRPTSVVGGIHAEQTNGLWQVTTIGDGCIDVDSGGAVASGIDFGALDLDLCPLNRQLVAQGEGTQTSRLPLDDLQLDFSIADTFGSLELADASVRIFGQSGLRLDFRGDRLEVPLELGDTEITISGQEPAVFFSASG